MRVLSLNTQRAYQPKLIEFLTSTLDSGRYDFLLLQEVDSKVLPSLCHPHYRLVRTLNEEAGTESEVCIAYRTSFERLRTGFQSFSSMRNDPWHGFRHPSFGLIWADFSDGGRELRVGSVHLHSGIDSKARRAELQLAEERLCAEVPMLTVLGGDFNAGYPGEASRLARMLSPEFIWMTRWIGPTLDSRYSENVPHLPNRIAAFLGMFNISIGLPTDHFFVRTTPMDTKAAVRKLPDRVSDHSPIELTVDL